jgi:phosphoribosylamine--glycine ligase
VKRFLFISKRGEGATIAWKIEQEGHKVGVYINDISYRQVGEGIVNKIKEWRLLVDDDGQIDEKVLDTLLKFRPDCIVFDACGKGFGELADKLKYDYRVIGCSRWGNTLELSREYSNQVMHAAGIKTPKSYSFINYDEAISFISEKAKPYVYKSEERVYVATGYEDLIGLLEYHRDTIPEKFKLYEQIYNCVEVSIGAWFNGKSAMMPYYSMVEGALLDGNRGPDVGYMGGVTRIFDKGAKLFVHSLGQMTDILAKQSYIGPFTINCLVTETEVYGLSFRASFDYDSVFSAFEMMRKEVGEFLWDLVCEKEFTVKLASDLCMGVNINVPPYPMPFNPKDYMYTLLQGLNNGNLKHLWFYDMQKVGDRWFSSGNGGKLGTLTAWGRLFEMKPPSVEAKRRIMRTINKLVIPDLIYRSDIGKRYGSDHLKLHKWGWV